MKIVTLIKLMVDSIAFVLSIACADYLYMYFKSENYTSPLFAIVTVYTIFISSLYSSGAYKNHRELVRISDLVSSLRGSLFAVFIYIVLSFMLKIEYSRIITITVFAILPMATISGRLIANFLFGHFKYFRVTENIVIYGAGTIGSEFEKLIKKLETTYNVIGYLDDNLVSDRILGTFNEIGNIVSNHSINRLIVAISELKDGHISEIESVANQYNLRVSYISSPTLMLNNHLKFRDFAGITMVTNYSLNENMFFLLAKRAIDIIIAGIGLVFSFPIWITLFIYTKLKNSGSLLFMQNRVGKDSKLFKIYKFRTMHPDTKIYNHCPTDSKDSRITPIGVYLRRYSIDELPQLVNVLRGEMSIVGPRPEMTFIVDRYNNFERQRLKMKPGITGLWQISPGRKHEITDNLEYDIYYLEHQSLTLDIVIIILTTIFVFKSFTH